MPPRPPVCTAPEQEQAPKGRSDASRSPRGDDEGGPMFRIPLSLHRRVRELSVPPEKKSDRAVARCRRSGMTRAEFGPPGVLDRVADQHHRRYVHLRPKSLSIAAEASRPCTSTRAPDCPSLRATSRPTPSVEPVTSAVFTLSFSIAGLVTGLDERDYFGMPGVRSRHSRR